MTSPAGQPPSAIVFLHGLGQMPQAWQSQVEAMPAGYRAFAPWVAGTKPTDTTPFTLDGAAAAVATLLQLNGVAAAHLVGLSLGGIVAMKVAVDYPEIVRSLTVAGAQARLGKTLMAMQRLALKRVPESQLPQARKQRLLEVTKELAGLDLLPGLRAVHAPTLVIAGDADRVGVAAGQEIAQAVPGATLTRIPGGADLNATSADEFNAAVFGFITQHDAPDGGRPS